MSDVFASVPTASTHQLVTEKSGSVVQFFLEASAFVSAFDPITKRSCAIVLKEADWLGSQGTAWISKITASVGTPLSRCELKIVGQPGAAQAAGAVLRAGLLTPKSYVERNVPRLELLFHPSEGRVRIASAVPATNVRAPNDKTRVLIVDDSATIRKLLTTVLSRDPSIEVVAAASLPSEVEALIIKHKPHVLTVDIHMPEMDGVTLLRKILPRYPLPAVMITSLSLEEGTKVLDALEAGAVDYIQKPSMEQLATMAPLIIEKVKSARDAKVVLSSRVAPAPSIRVRGSFDSQKLIAIGSSTGGTEALRVVLTRLPENIPPILIVQHIPAVFSLAFANRMDSLCPFEVKEAANGDEVRANRVLIAAGGTQMKLVRRGASLHVQVDDSPPVNRHKPSVDVLFDSVAEVVGRNALGAILTGMGADGARGMLKMKQAGARTIAQDEASCVVFGMPREAIKLGAADKIAPLDQIADWLVQQMSSKADAA